MPLYEYRCSKCESVFEVLQKFSDPPLTTHEGCGGTVERLISAPGFQFKGTGWYVTDYKSSGAKSETKSADSGKKSDAAKSETKSASTDTKTESKSAETAKKND